MFQWKYLTNLLEEMFILGSKPIDTPIYPSIDFNGELLIDPGGDTGD